MPQNRLNIAYIIEIVAFVYIVLGIVPRWWALVLAAGIAIYLLIVPLEEGTLFFIRSIPFFIALPITQNFDSLNTWRIASLILFAKFIFFEKPKFKLSPLTLLLLISILSIFVASDQILGVKRIIYFLNISFIGIILYNLKLKTEDVVHNMLFPFIAVIIVGVLQVFSTYIFDFDQFMSFWADRVQYHQYGYHWVQIIFSSGHTWIAEFAGTLSLRVFSLITDSHAFPVFALLGIPALIASNLRPHWKYLFLATAFLLIILSGTRGIWLASLAGLVCALYFKKFRLHLLTFYLLFIAAFGIIISPQFHLGGDARLLSRRLSSILDSGETSNTQRLEIWKKSLASIAKHPVLGVGVGNFPVVLNQDVSKAKAGSSAHNLYLHIAAEMGIPALIFVLIFFYRFLQSCYANAHNPYFAALFLYGAWILVYSLVDIALIEERALLFFAATAALAFRQET